MTQNGRRPAILFVAPAVPSASGNGLAMRLGLFLEALLQVGEVDLVVLPLTGPPVPSPLCERLGVRPKFIPVAGRADTHYSLVMGLPDNRERRAAFAAYGRPSLTASLSTPVLADLKQAMGRRSYDLVHVSRAYLLPVLALWPEMPAPVISLDLDEDDVGACERQSALYRLRGDDHRADWEILEALAFDRLREEWLKRVDILMIASELERNRLESRHPGTDTKVVPNAVELPDVLPAPTDGGLLFVGGFGHFPNLDAALWLCEEIWPRLHQVGATSTKLTIVGRYPPPRLSYSARQAGIEIRADIADLAPLYRRAALALAPLRAGGGTRLKLLEASAWSVPAVSTPVGVEGLELVDGQHLWIAEDAAGFAAACTEALNRPDERRRRGAAAREVVSAHHDRRKVAGHLAAMLSARLDEVLRRGVAPRSVGADP